MQNHSDTRRNLNTLESNITSHIPDRHVLGSGKEYLEQSIKYSPYSVIEEDKVGDAINLASTPRVETPLSSTPHTTTNNKRRLVVDKHIKRQEKSLQIYEQKQKEWENIAKRLARRFGRDASNLVMERSGVEYRTKMEEIEMFEATVPLSQRHNNSSWEMSLRNGDSSGVRYVKVGGSWPYPLYCPVVQKQPNLPSTVRNPFKSQLLNERSVLGIRNMKSDYVRQRYGKYFKKMKGIHDPTEEISELKLIGTTLNNNSEYQIQRNRSFDMDDFNVDDLEKDIQHMENQVESSGPEFSLSSNALIFETTPSHLSNTSLTLTNSGTCVLQYSWERLPYIDELQQARSQAKFQLATNARGVILPGSSKTFLFSFLSDIEGIFSDGFRLDTVPAIDHQKCNPILRLRGISISDKNNINEKTFELMEKRLLDQSQQTDYDTLSCIEKPGTSPSLPDLSVQHQKRLIESFIDKNQHLFSTPLIVSQDMFNKIQTMAIMILSDKGENSFPDTWDLSLTSLSLYLHQIRNENRESLDKLMKDMWRVLSCSNNSSSSLHSRLYYSICYEQVLDAVDQIVDTAVYLEEKLLVEDISTKRKPSEVAKKGGKTSTSRPNSRQAEGLASDIQHAQKERYGMELRLQSSMILCNTLDRIENLWKVSSERFSVFDSK